LQTKVKTADLVEAMDGMTSDGTSLELEKKEGWSTLNKKDYVSSFIESMKASGLDIA
jgi:phage portal protein BeeE